ncbi:CHASE2 domain-containing protein [Thiovibrio sp. JS02]
MGKKTLAGLGLALLAFGLALLCGRLGLLDDLENTAWRWRVAAFAEPRSSTGRIRIIALDQKSLDWGSRENGLSWPWPRQAYATLFAFCRRAGVRVIALDMLFSEPSLYGPADDQALGAAMAENGRVVASCIPAGAACTLPVPEVVEGAARLASISGRPDADGVFRRAPLLVTAGEKQIPSLALAAYLVGAGGEIPHALSGRGLRLGNRLVPTDGAGRSILNFRGPAQTIRTISMAAVIQAELQIEAGEKPALAPEELADAYVFVGMTAPGLFDLRAAPLAGVYPGVEIHATMLDNLLANDFLRDSPAWLNLGALLLMALVAAVASLFCRNAWHSLLAFFLLLPLPLAGGFAAYRQGLWLPVAVQSLAVLLSLLGGVLFNFATEGRKKRYIKRAFGQYLHPTVIEQLVNQPERLRLGGEKRELSIFFADLQGFTTLSEQLDPERLTLLLNEYLSAMTEIIMEEGGTIDKYEGDAILAFWNAPLAQADHARRAVRAALRCQARLAAKRPEFKSRFGFDLFMRVGINTGTVLVGNLGSSQRFDYSILGDGVNIAARLEGVNKEFGTPILISAATRQQLGEDFLVREIGRVKVLGREEPITIFEPMAEGKTAMPAPLCAFARGLARYYQGDFPEALACFGPLAAEDAPAARYVDRCRVLLAAPPPGWDGVWKMSGK